MIPLARHPKKKKIHVKMAPVLLAKERWRRHKLIMYFFSNKMVSQMTSEKLCAKQSVVEGIHMIAKSEGCVHTSERAHIGNRSEFLLSLLLL